MNEKRGVLFTFYTYYKRGHAAYLALGIGLLNTVGIWYGLLGFNQFIKSVVLFGFIFTPSYVCVAVFLGWMDLRKRKGSYETEAGVLYRANPEWRRLIALLTRIARECGVEEEELTMLLEGYP